MTGFLADFFRLVGGLLYWNTRKSWFQLRRGRSPCPCQSPSDSGRALETHCEAAIHWNSAARFRRVCPLLVKTDAGWRCSVNTAEVRPFWGRAFGYYGGAVVALYLVGVIGVFIFLRLVGYPVSVFQVVWPPAWHRVGEARGSYFLQRAQHAFDANRPSEAILYLTNAYEFDPSNYGAGLTLAKTLQSGQPVLSNRIYERLLHEHPAHREDTAQEWFRALLARGDFETVALLARDEVLAGGRYTSVWMRALVFATRQTRRDDALRALRTSDAPAATAWRPLLDTQIFLLAQQKADAFSVLSAGDWTRVPAYGIFYQVDQLSELGDPFAALDVLGRNAATLDDETRVTLQLMIFARQHSSASAQRLVGQLLGAKLSLPVIKILAAQLIRYPDADTLQQVMGRVRAEKIPFTTESAGAVYSLLCAAGANADWTAFNEVRATIVDRAPSSAGLIVAAESFFRGRSGTSRITSFLPALPLPLEVNYALIERYPGTLPATRSSPAATVKLPASSSPAPRSP